MNVLLTGGAGYIGSHVAYNLIDAGHSVHIVDNLITKMFVIIDKSNSVQIILIYGMFNFNLINIFSLKMKINNLFLVYFFIKK